MTPAAPRQGDPSVPPAWRGLFAVGALGALIVLAGVLLLIGFGSEDSATVIDLGWLNDPPSGPVRYCSGEDVSGSQQKSVGDFKRQYPGVDAVLDQGSAAAGDQHDEYLDRLSESSASPCDVVYLDVIYLPEFAQKGLLYDMTPYLQHASPTGGNRARQFDPRMMETVRYDDKLWGVPKHLDAGVMFYRPDAGIHFPRSWTDVLEQAKPQQPDVLPRLRFQSAAYEGLTVVFLEIASSAGAGPIISADGKHAALNQKPAIRAVEFMRRAFLALPKRERDDKQSLWGFEHGRALLMRSWPFAAARIHRDAQEARQPSSKRHYAAAELQRTAQNFRVAPLPPWRQRGENIGILGGHDLVIPHNAPHPHAALRLIDYLTSRPQLRQDAAQFSLFPVTKSLQRSQELTSGNTQNTNTIPAIEKTTLKHRPIIASYDAVSRVISKRLSDVLRGQADIETALNKLDQDIQRMLDEVEK